MNSIPITANSNPQSKFENVTLSQSQNPSTLMVHSHSNNKQPSTHIQLTHIQASFSPKIYQTSFSNKPTWHYFKSLILSTSFPHMRRPPWAETIESQV